MRHLLRPIALVTALIATLMLGLSSAQPLQAQDAPATLIANSTTRTSQILM